VTKTEKQIEQTRADLDSINSRLTTLDAQRADALKTSAAFAKWRLAHEEAELERERLELLVDKLVADLEREKSDAARFALEARRAELEQESAALARRIVEEGTAAAEVLMRLAEQARANAESIERFNRELGDEDAPLFSADHLARHRAPEPRQDIAEDVVDLWVFESSGELVGDPDSVIEREYAKGIILSPMRNIPVERRRFRQVSYLEAGAFEWIKPLGEVLRLPNFNAPGMMFDRGQRVEPSQRRELVELIPAPDAPAKPVTEAA
jgi:hypothetical protein